MVGVAMFLRDLFQERNELQSTVRVRFQVAERGIGAYPDPSRRVYSEAAGHTGGYRGSSPSDAVVFHNRIRCAEIENATGVLGNGPHLAGAVGFLSGVIVEDRHSELCPRLRR